MRKPEEILVDTELAGHLKKAQEVYVAVVDTKEAHTRLLEEWNQARLAQKADIDRIASGDERPDMLVLLRKSTARLNRLEDALSTSERARSAAADAYTKASGEVWKRMTEYLPSY